MFKFMEELLFCIKVYYELWFKDFEMEEREFVGGVLEDEMIELFYGKIYLFCKFKMVIGLCYDNCVDIYMQDFGLFVVI